MKKKKASLLLTLVLAVLAAVFGVTNTADTPEATLPAGSQVEIVATTQSTAPENTEEVTEAGSDLLDPDGSYTTKEDVALYIYTYGCLPKNFITKDEARTLGWESGGLDEYAYGCCIGGDRFGNYEGLLPDAEGRTWTECDIDTMHASKRGAKRIVFSSDGLIYYTDDHYESFELLYGDAE